MKDVAATLSRRDVDGLRLLGLSRIPRCASCPRLEGFLAAFEAGRPLTAPVPAPPSDCDYRICAPLVPCYFRPPSCRSKGTTDDVRAIAG